MNNKTDELNKAAELRQRAEELAQRDALPQDESLSAAQTLHELRVYQIELEMQNEELRRTQAELDAERARYFDLYNLAPVGYVTLSEQGLILEANLKAATLLGAPRGALIKQPFPRFIFKEDADFLYLQRKKAIITRTTQVCELRMLKIDGVEFWACLDMTAAHGADGELVSLVTLSDITERKLYMEDLRLSEERYRLVATNVPDIIYSLDGAGNIVSVNSPAFERYGYTEQDSQGKPFLNFIHPDDRPIVIGSFVQALQKQRKFTHGLQFRIVAENGKNYWFELNSQAHFASDGRYLGEEGILRDITERIQVEEALRIAEAGYRDIFDNATVGIFQSTPQGQFSRVNPFMARIYGYASPEEMTASITNISRQIYVAPDDRQKFQQILAEHGQVSEFVGKNYRKDRSIIWTETTARAEKDAQGQVLCYEGFITDITERKQAEDALAQQSEAMSQLNQFSMELSTISVDENLEALITRWVKKITGATLATFNEYNYENRTITTHHIEVESGLRENIVRRLGKRIKKFHFVVSDEMYQQMITERIGKRSTLHEASLGTISPPIGAALQVLLKVDRFIGISYLIEGKLYGTSMLAMNVDQIDPPKNILERFISLATVSLRRKQAEEHLRSSEERFRSLASSFKDIIYSLDTQQRHSGVYGNWVENIGLTPEFFLGKTSREIFGAEAALVHEEANRYALAGEAVTYEWSAPAASGVSYYQTAVSPLRNSQGEIVGIVGVGRDITERRAAEENIRLLNIELEKLALTDYLTNLYNRRYFMLRGAEEFKRAQRNNQPLALLMLDIDEFKKGLFGSLRGYPRIWGWYNW